MTPREGQATATKVQGLGAPSLAPGHGPLFNSEPAAEKGASRTPGWESLFPSLSPVQQQELLALASRQGLVYSHQVPVVSPRSRIPSAAENLAQQFVGRLLSGRPSELDPVQPQAPSIQDEALDENQRDAVARAVGTPDICLLQGLPGTGKSRVIAEIITQAASQGWRVLFLAPSSAAIDRVLEVVGSATSICALRCLGREENIETLAPSVRALTFAERLRGLAEISLQHVQESVDQEEQQRLRFRRQEAIWPALGDLAQHWQDLQAQQKELARQQADCRAQVDREAQGIQAIEKKDPSADGLQTPAAVFVGALACCEEQHQETLARIEAGLKVARQKMEEGKQELEKREPDGKALRLLVAARQKGRWWTPTWWRALIKGNVQGRLAELEELQKHAHEALAGLEEQLRLLEQDRAEAGEKRRAEWARLVDAETTRRQAVWQERETLVRQDQRLVESKWLGFCQELEPGPGRPAELTRTAIQAAQEAWRRQGLHQEEQLAFSREWAAHLKEARATLATRLPDYLNLIAATLGSLGRDEHFGAPSGLGAGFDLLVLEEADQVTEAEFLNLAQRARRWVLVGEPAWEPGPDENGRDGRTVFRSPFHAPSLFRKLWQRLHCDPRTLPYAWFQEHGRLGCRLRAVPAEQRRWLETERVADSPDIELRILAIPRTQPLLAEVVFPPAMSIQQAKSFIYHELEELAVQASQPSFHWADEGEKLVLHLGDPGTGEKTCIHLEPGICEKLAPLTFPAADSTAVRWQTCRVEFDKSLGWHRPQAEDWVRRHLGTADLGRTASLDILYRMQPGLGAFIADLLFQGLCQLAPEGGEKTAEISTKSIAGCAIQQHHVTKTSEVGSQPTDARPSRPCVEFVAVPPLAPEVSSRRPGGEGRGRANGARVAAASAPRFAKGGAGLELDLTSPRPGDRLPGALRGLLPAQGMVNYFEAQAVVRRVESLVADFKRQAAPASDPRASLSHSQAASRSLPALAVVALYPAQSQLIRVLLEQSPHLKGSNLDVEVGVPSSFRQREAAVVLLSLTRSHSHRAVSFGEGPLTLALALTRARHQLIIFGDPGTLVRRTRWDGPVDHLDELAAGSERALIARLVDYLQGQGRHTAVFHLCEGSGA